MPLNSHSCILYLINVYYRLAPPWPVYWTVLSPVLHLDKYSTHWVFLYIIFNKFFENVIQYTLIIFSPSPPSPTLSILTHPTSSLFSWVIFLLPKSFWVWSLPWNISYQSPILPQPGWTHLLSHAGIWLDFAHILWVLINATAVLCSKFHCNQLPPHPPLSSSLRIPELLGEGDDIDVPFRAKHS